MGACGLNGQTNVKAPISGHAHTASMSSLQKSAKTDDLAQSKKFVTVPLSASTSKKNLHNPDMNSIRKGEGDIIAFTVVFSF